MHGLEWVFSAVLALVFLVTGVTKAFRYEQAKKSFLWAKDVPRALVHLTGVAEILGAVGLILPVATGIYPWLTLVAAVVLEVLMLVAAQSHARRHERAEVYLNLLLAVMLGFVYYVRWPLLP